MRNPQIWKLFRDAAMTIECCPKSYQSKLESKLILFLKNA
jgi:hypothetical protein